MSAHQQPLLSVTMKRILGNARWYVAGLALPYRIALLRGRGRTGCSFPEDLVPGAHPRLGTEHHEWPIVTPDGLLPLWRAHARILRSEVPWRWGDCLADAGDGRLRRLRGLRVAQHSDTWVDGVWDGRPLPDVPPVTLMTASGTAVATCYLDGQ